MLNFKIVESQKLIFSKGPVVAADTTNLEAKFEANDLFDGTLRAYWNVRGSAVDSFKVDLDASGMCTIPSEVLASISDPSMYGDIDHILQVSVVSIGEDDTIRITSTTCEIPVYKSSYTGNVSQPSEPSGDGNITNIITGAAINGEQMDFYNGNNVIFSTSLANLKNFLLPIAGGNMQGNINMDGHAITGLPDAVKDTDALALAFAKTLFAPSGYGLGEELESIFAESASETDAVFCEKIDAVLAEMGDFEIKFVKATAPAVFGAGVYACVLYKYDADFAEMRVISSYSVSRFGWRFLKTNGEWGSLEWINPPMTPGVEYETTRRRNGRPVFVKTINCGTLPNNAYKDVSIGVTIADLDDLKCVTTSSSGSKTMLPNVSTNVYASVINNNAIRIYSFEHDSSTSTAIAEIWYTKG